MEVLFREAAMYSRTLYFFLGRTGQKQVCGPFFQEGDCLKKNTDLLRKLSSRAAIWYHKKVAGGGGG